ncbi:expressed protein [Phakopsora pachyrhizi]|uniref:Expressed protein n=1 Tax=Phakopsora pachyrhizi TaxID=170000 RepID=A0AAV0BRB9_PHAPC|nr:expressed protein [Phakopsora pachyrhizi]
MDFFDESLPNGALPAGKVSPGLNSSALGPLLNVIHNDSGASGDKNPYFVVHDYISQNSLGEKIFEFDSPLTRTYVFLLIMLLAQSLRVLYVMTSTGRMKLISRTAIGMWKFETINIHGVFSLLFSLTAGSLFVLEKTVRVYDEGRNFSICYALLVGKLLCVPATSWAFVWASVCHWVSLTWIPQIKSTGVPLREGDQVRLPWFLRYLTHILFLLPLVIISSLSAWSSKNIISDYSRIISGRTSVLEQLAKAGESYKKETYDAYRLIAITQPLLNIPNEVRNFFSQVRIALVVYLAAEIFLQICYAPLLYVCLRDLNIKTKNVATLIESNSFREVRELNSVIDRLAKTRKILVYRGMSVYLCSASYLPILCFELSRRPYEPSAERRTWETLKKVLGLTVALALNINLLIINIYCQQVLRSHNQQRKIVEELEESELAKVDEGMWIANEKIKSNKLLNSNSTMV